MDKEEQIPNMDLSKTVPISNEEEAKLVQFLKRMQEGIKGDTELEVLLGGTIDKWSQ
jgi:hypothetical protein